MTVEREKLLDATGWRLLRELQQEGRCSYKELGQRVGLSLPAVAERVRKMEEEGIITGYHAEVNLAKLGLPVEAIVHLQGIGGHSCRDAQVKVNALPEVIESYRVTGSDAMIVKLVAASLDHLARVIDELSLVGIPSTSLVRQRPFKRRVIPHEIVERGDGDVQDQ